MRTALDRYPRIVEEIARLVKKNPKSGGEVNVYQHAVEILSCHTRQEELAELSDALARHFDMKYIFYSNRMTIRWVYDPLANVFDPMFDNNQ